MQVFTFHRQGLDLESFEVEASFMPGLPRIHLSGLADTAARESLLRVRAAIMAADFELPNRDQVILNLKPAYIKKQSQGIDLAIALSYLLKSDQLHETHFFNQLLQNNIKSIFVYGELGLDGQIYTPEDFEFIKEKILDEKSLLITGPLTQDLGARLHGKMSMALENLRDVFEYEGDFGKNSGEEQNSGFDFEKFIEASRPRRLNIEFAAEAAELMTLIAAGEHSCLLLGPAGTGKTTFIDSLYGCLRSPTPDEFGEIKKLGKIFGLTPNWRPFVAPHHSATSISLIGGGAPPMPGEITRAHRGVLYLDEFLEFQSDVKEALREPVEKKEIRIARKGSAQVFPAAIVLLASSNMCPCGQMRPNKRTVCGRTVLKCRSYVDKLSGPMLDRFDVVGFSHLWGSPKNVSVDQIYERTLATIAFAKNVRGQTKPNSHLSLSEAEEGVDPLTLESFLPPLPGSVRRRLALLKVARTYADMKESRLVLPHHLEQAKRVSIQSFDELRRMWN